jgi:hypothetical protein
LLALSWTVKVPVLVPLALGSKKTPIEHDAPGARVLPQVLKGAKSAGVAVTLAMLSTPSVTFTSTMDWGKPEVPTYW